MPTFAEPFVDKLNANVQHAPAMNADDLRNEPSPLRADLLDGTWTFTASARAGLHSKTTEISKLVMPLLNQYPAISGLVLSNGPGVAQGQFVSESAPSSNHSYGLRRILPARA